MEDKIIIKKEEGEPKYFSEFRKEINRRFDLLDSKIEKEVGSLAISTANEFSNMNTRFDAVDNRLHDIDVRLDDIDTHVYDIESDIADIKVDIGKIEGHIGRYEIRSQNLEYILLEDYKPRIRDLERKVFA